MLRTVLYVVSTLARTGPVNVLAEIVRHLDPSRYRAVIATLSAEPETSRMAELQAGGVAIRQLNHSRQGSFLFGPRRLNNLAREVDACILHTHGFRADVLARLARLQCPVLSTLHCNPVQDYQLAYGIPPGRLMAACHYRALRRLDAVVTVAENVAEAARRHGVGSRVIRNGIDLNVFRPPADQEEMGRVRRKLKWREDAIVLLHTGALIDRKNPIEVVKGFRCSQMAENALLAVAGEGPLRARCEQAADGDSRVMFLGARSDVAELLKGADVLVSNSSEEGLPLALLEGCAAGVHVLASRIPAHQRISELFAEQVTLYSLGGAASLAEALDKLGRANRQRVTVPPADALEKISGRFMSRQYQELYDALT